MLNITAKSGAVGKEHQDDRMLIDILGRSGDTDYSVEQKISNDIMCVFAIADGVGGHTKGNIAAEKLIKKIERMFFAQKIYAFSEINIGLIEHILREYVKELECMEEDLIGTTVSIVFVDSDFQVKIFNVGDSPIYHYDSLSGKLYDRFTKMALSTKENSVIEKIYDFFSITESKYVLTYAVGKNMEFKIYEEAFQMKTGDKLLLSSDGLTVSNIVLQEMLSKECTAEDLFDYALKNKPKDNVSVILIECKEEEFLNDSCFVYDAATSTGSSRMVNEDRFIINDICKSFDTTFHWINTSVNQKKKWNMAAVADGVTGSYKGRIAASICVDILQREYIRGRFDVCHDTEELKIVLINVLNQVKQTIAKEIVDKGDFGESATSLSIIFFDNKVVHVFNLGDSPIMLMRDGVLYELFEKQAVHDRLTEYISSETLGNIHYTKTSFEDKDQLILMTDGIDKVFSKSDIIEAIGINKHSTKMMVESGLRKNADDNLTIMVIKKVETRDE